MKVSIILSGGGIKGAFEVGALRYINERISLDDIEAISGTSVGALNGALFSYGDFETLLTIWQDKIQNKYDILGKWFLGYINGFFKGGLYNLKPLKKLIYEYVDVDRLTSTKVRFFPCAVDIDTGEKVYLENLPENKYLLRDFILSSATIPIMFPPVKVAGRRLVDGGVKEPIPVKIIVDNTKNTDKFIIILASKYEKNRHSIGKINLYKASLRTIDLMFDEIFQNDIQTGTSKYWKEKFVIIEPPYQIFEGTFDVSHKNIMEAIEVGYETARNRLEGVL
jgi:NTE family protein